MNFRKNVFNNKLIESIASKITNYLLENKELTPSKSILCRIVLERNSKKTSSVEKFSRVFDNSKWTDSSIQGPTYADFKGFMYTIFNSLFYIFILLVMCTVFSESVCYYLNSLKETLEVALILIFVFVYTSLQLVKEYLFRKLRLELNNVSDKVINKLPTNNLPVPKIKNVVNNTNSKNNIYSLFKSEKELQSTIQLLNLNSLNLLSLINPRLNTFTINNGLNDLLLLQPKNKEVALYTNSIDSLILNDISRNYIIQIDDIKLNQILPLYKYSPELVFSNVNIDLNLLTAKELRWAEKSSQLSHATNWWVHMHNMVKKSIGDSNSDQAFWKSNLLYKDITNNSFVQPQNPTLTDEKLVNNLINNSNIKMINTHTHSLNWSLNRFKFTQLNNSKNLLSTNVLNKLENNTKSVLNDDITNKILLTDLTINTNDFNLNINEKTYNLNENTINTLNSERTIYDFNNISDSLSGNNLSVFAKLYVTTTNNTNTIQLLNTFNPNNSLEYNKPQFKDFKKRNK